MIDVSIIMVNYKTLEMTQSAIKSICEYTKGISFEIIVIDNGSDDGSVENLMLDKRIKVISSKTNLGFGRANNLGLEYASGRNILFLNTDTKILDNSIRILSTYLDTHPEVGAIGGNLIDANGNPNQSFERIFPGPFHVLNSISHGVLNKIRFKNNVTYCHSREPIEVAYIIGADLMVPRNILKNIGAFDPIYFMYYEETDLCFRIKNAGFKVMIHPASTIIHYEGGSGGGRLKDFNQVRTQMYYESRRKFIKKNFNTMKGRCTNVLFSIFLGLRILIGRPHAKQMFKIYKNSLIENYDATKNS